MNVRSCCWLGHSEDKSIWLLYIEKAGAMTDDDMLGPPEPAAWLVDPPAPEPMVIASLLIDVCQHHSAGKHIDDNLIQNNQDTHF